MISINDVKGIGPRNSMLFEKIDIRTVDDLVSHYPYRYDLIKRTNLEEAQEMDKVIVDGKIDSSPILIRLKGNLNKMNLRLITSDGKIVGVSIFNRAFLKNSLKVGSNITVFGKYEKSKNIILASEIRQELLPKGEKIESVYHGTSGLTSKTISTFINTALMQYGNEITDYIPKYLTIKYDFLNKKTALNIIHNPSSMEKLEEAKRRLKYEELFLFMTKINYLKLKNKKIKNGIERTFDEKKLKDLIKSLPYKLTEDQQKVLQEIIEDLTSSRRMNRLLQGDVGSGKTIISILAMYVNYLSGYQSALMVPTEILANQHYENFKNLLEGYNIEIALLTGSTKKSEKNKIYDRLKSGKINMVIGTHAIIEDDIKYNNLGLVITDEQHRFGVNQRNNLRNKGNMPDVLYMSATPIPRTYALTIYGDMDISIINTMPSGRKKIITKVFDNSDIKKVLVKIKQELDLGHQIYIVSPLIEDSEEEMEDTKKLEKKFKLAFKNYNIGVMHGKLSPKEKNKVMDDFVNKKIDILISTTVIEVGVDVKNATMIVIFDAYKFGLATLHQLRGRVGRNSEQSYCVLMTNRETERLNIMENVSDGFTLAEEDLKLRGSGDLFGIKQSGDMSFKLANIQKDYELLIKAKADSEEVLDNIDKYEVLKNMLKESINMD